MRRIPTPIRNLGLLLIPACLVAVVGFAWAQHPGHGKGGYGSEEMAERVFDRLELDATQRDQMTRLHERHRQAMELHHDALQASHEVLESLIDSEEFDESAIREASAEFGRLQTEMFVARAEMQQEARKILTPEQFEELKQIRDRHHGPMMGRFGAHHGRFEHHREAQGLEGP
jgi:Spy/CpxP family protein refolding chaperone